MSNALVIHPVPEFIDFLTPAARAVYELPDVGSCLFQFCTCNQGFDSRATPEHMATHDTEKCLGKCEHGKPMCDCHTQLTIPAITMSQKFGVTFLATAVRKTDPVRLRAHAVERLAKSYNIAVEKGFIQHGGLSKACVVELPPDGLEYKYAVFLLPFVKNPVAGKVGWKEALKILNEAVRPPRSNLPCDFFKSEGEV